MWIAVFETRTQNILQNISKLSQHFLFFDKVIANLLLFRWRLIRFLYCLLSCRLHIDQFTRCSLLLTSIGWSNHPNREKHRHIRLTLNQLCLIMVLKKLNIILLWFLSSHNYRLRSRHLLYLLLTLRKFFANLLLLSLADPDSRLCLRSSLNKNLTLFHHELHLNRMTIVVASAASMLSAWKEISTILGLRQIGSLVLILMLMTTLSRLLLIMSLCCYWMMGLISSIGLTSATLF